uniref:Uncharacterized protein n=1 Tax=Aegilops tauschii subsp. strangulata TaxID=200361 RepID=A0A453QHT6_AEGTS
SQRTSNESLVRRQAISLEFERKQFNIFACRNSYGGDGACDLLVLTFLYEGTN